jgi:hypothetical protein
MRIGQYHFNGPYRSIDSLGNIKGIYLILNVHRNEASLKEIGKSDKIKDKIITRSKKDNTANYHNDNIVFVALYTFKMKNQKIRFIIKEINDYFDYVETVPCDE